MSKHIRILALLAVVLLIPFSLQATYAQPNQPMTKEDCKRGGWRNYEHLGFRTQGDCIVFVLLGSYVCEDPLGCIAYPEGDPVRLATAFVTSGPVSFLGIDELRGVELALDFHGDLFGHPLQLHHEDTTCDYFGGEQAANAIVADPTLAAVVGTSCSSAAIAAAPIISNAGYSMVSPSNTTPILTDPDAHSPGYLRTAWNDLDQAEEMAAYVITQGATTSAVIVDGSTYTVSLGEAFVDSFEADGGNNSITVIAHPDGSDAVTAIAAIVAAGMPDVIYFPVFPQLGVELVLAAQVTPELDGTLLTASDALVNQIVIDALGDAAEGILFTAPDASFTGTPEYAAFAGRYYAKYAEYPLTHFSAYAFDATNVILAGIAEVGAVDGKNTLHVGRQALRDALFATSAFQGLTGTITCDMYGDCSTMNFMILTVNGGVFVPVP